MQCSAIAQSELIQLLVPGSGLFRNCVQSEVPEFCIAVAHTCLKHCTAPARRSIDASDTLAHSLPLRSPARQPTDAASPE